jgi:hypothetical protein
VLFVLLMEVVALRGWLLLEVIREEQVALQQEQLAMLWRRGLPVFRGVVREMVMGLCRVMALQAILEGVGVRPDGRLVRLQ